MIYLYYCVEYTGFHTFLAKGGDYWGSGGHAPPQN